MITVPPGVRVLVWPTPVDFRRGMDSLAALVQVTLRLDRGSKPKPAEFLKPLNINELR